jgi:aspartate carbamoyltransferase regulatory subunit
MSEREKMLVQKISDGTVIDHVSAGRALSVLRLLSDPQDRGVTVALVMNVESSKMGRKDILKVEGVELTDEQIQKLALIAPLASVNIIRSYKVSKKKKAVLPKKITGVLRCTATTCVSVREKDSVPSVFFLVSTSPLVYRCKYCGRDLSEREISVELG